MHNMEQLEADFTAELNPGNLKDPMKDAGATSGNVWKVPAHTKNDDLLFEVPALEQGTLVRTVTHADKKVRILAQLQVCTRAR